MIIHYHSGASLPSTAAKAVHVMKMCAALARHGTQVTLFAKGDPKIDDTAIFHHYNVAQNFRLVRSRNLTPRGISGLWRIFANTWAARRMPRPDLAYGREPLGLLLGTHAETPLAFEAHQVPHTASHKFAIRRVIQRPGFRGIIAISQQLKNDLLQAFPELREDQVLVAHDGADIPEGTPRPKTLPGRGHAPKIGYTGSLHPGKGAAMLAELAQRMPACDFHICGGSKDQIATLQHESAPDNLYFHSHVAHAELQNYIAAFDIVLAPYGKRATIAAGQDISRWISPMKLFEYMAAEKPVIATDLPVIREVLGHEHNALLAAPDDCESWHGAVQRLVDEPELAGKLAEKGYHDLKTQFTWQQRAAKILAFLAR